MAAPAGWRLVTVNGTRRAVNPEGSEVSYNAYLNAQAQQSGFANHSAYVRWERENRDFLRGWRRIADNKSELQLGATGLARLRMTFFRSDLTRKDDPPLRQPGGQLARLLEQVGIRPRGTPDPVGETNPQLLES